MAIDYNAEDRLKNICNESKSESIVRRNKEEYELFSRHLIDPKKLENEIYSHQYIHGLPYLANGSNNDDIRTMSTYNALRYLYRKEYDLRSCGKRDYNNPDSIVGREINPLNNCVMDINYYNDFSISPKFNYIEDCDYKNSITDIYQKSCWAFVSNDSKYKNFSKERKLKFFTNEFKTKKNGYTSNFFSNNRQVNPLLYAYSFYDENNVAHPMDADYFLENNWYVRKEDSFTMKGNQSSIPIWIPVTDCSYTYIQDDDGNTIGLKYNNQYWLFNDDYTNTFYTMIQMPNNYFNILYDGKYSNREDRKLNVDETRGFLVYDMLLSIVKNRMITNISNDANAPEDAIDKVNRLFEVIDKCRIDDNGNGGEGNGFPIDQYLSLDNYRMYNSKDAKSVANMIEKIGSYIINSYRNNYNIVFGSLFRLLPMILTPSYQFDIISPAMSIFFSALTIYAIKNMYYNDKESYNIVVDNLTSITYDLNNSNVRVDKNYISNAFNKVFDKKTLSKNMKDSISIILEILSKNTTAINEDMKDVDNEDIDNYFTEGNYKCWVDNSNVYSNIKDKLENNWILSNDRAIIMLTEFIKKMEGIRFFDASTFAIDYKIFDNETSVKIGKWFSDSLLEASYIHLNSLGTDVFFDGTLPGHINNVKNINPFDEVVGLDTTRIAKQNCELYNRMENKDGYAFNNNNSYHSYLAMVNLYTSLAYCIRITIDNLNENNYSAGPYNNNKISRPYSIWAITKRYSIHLAYINHNGCGIYNAVKVSNTNLDETRKYMIAHRVKLLTYGLHLRVWYNDNYLFYTNYKKLMMNTNNDVNIVSKLSNDYYTHYGELKEFPLFRDSKYNGTKDILVALPNVGLATAPMAGSYTINCMAACLHYYLSGLEYSQYLTNLIHHGLKDIMVGDSMSSIMNGRLKNVISLLNTGLHLSYNNINNRMQKAFEVLGDTSMYEMAIGSNLECLVKNVFKPYLTDNQNDIRALNIDSINNTYDLSYFTNTITNTRCGYVLGFNNTWLERMFIKELNGNNKTSYLYIIGKLLPIYDAACVNYNHSHNKETSFNLKKWNDKYFGFSTMIASLINEYNVGIDKIINNPKVYGIFNKIMKVIFYGLNKHRISNVLGNTNAKMSFENAMIINCASVPVYTMYESPMMLALFNNMNFGINISDELPTEQNMYLTTKSIMICVHSIMRRLIIDLSLNGDPIVRIIKSNDNITIDNAQHKFINDCVTEYGMSTNSTDFSIESSNAYKDIISTGDSYQFAASLSQFMDYDFVYSNLKSIFNNQFDINKADDNKRYLNMVISNRGNDFNKYIMYCNIIDKMSNLNNELINDMIKRGYGSIATKNKNHVPSIDNHKKDLEVIIDNIDNNVVNCIEPDFIEEVKCNEINDPWLYKYIKVDSIGITDEDYAKMSEEEKKEYDDQVKTAKEIDNKNEEDYLKEVNRIEHKLFQMRRAHQLSKGEKVNPDTEFIEYNENSNMSLLDKECFGMLGGDGFEVNAMRILSRLINVSDSTVDTVKDIANDLKELKNDIKFIRTAIELLNSGNVSPQIIKEEKNIAQETTKDESIKEDIVKETIPDPIPSSEPTISNEESNHLLENINMPENYKTLTLDMPISDNVKVIVDNYLYNNPIFEPDYSNYTKWQSYVIDYFRFYSIDDYDELSDEEKNQLDMLFVREFISNNINEAYFYKKLFENDFIINYYDNNLPQNPYVYMIIDTIKNNTIKNYGNKNDIKKLMKISNEMLEKDIADGLIDKNKINRANNPITVNHTTTIRPLIHTNHDITVYNGKGESMVIPYDDSCEPLDALDKYFDKHPITENRDAVESKYNEDDVVTLYNSRYEYNDYYYIPKRYLLKNLPKHIKDPKFDKDKKAIEEFNKKNPMTDKFLLKIYNAVNKGIRPLTEYSQYKCAKYNVPVYLYDLDKFILPFDNIPIYFNQKVEFIIQDIIDRVLPMNEKWGKYILDYITRHDKIFNKDVWDIDMTFGYRKQLCHKVWMDLKRDKGNNITWDTTKGIYEELPDREICDSLYLG